MSNDKKIIGVIVKRSVKERGRDAVVKTYRPATVKEGTVKKGGVNPPPQGKRPPPPKGQKPSKK